MWTFSTRGLVSHSQLSQHPSAISIVAVPNFHRRLRRSKFLERLEFSKEVVDLSFFKSAPTNRASTKVEILPDRGSPFHFLTDLSSNDSRNKPARGSPLPDRSRNFALSFRTRRPPFVFSFFFTCRSILGNACFLSALRSHYAKSDIGVSIHRVRNPNGNRRLKWIRKILKDKRGRLISIADHFFFFFFFCSRYSFCILVACS